MTWSAPKAGVATLNMRPEAPAKQRFVIPAAVTVVRSVRRHRVEVIDHDRLPLRETWSHTMIPNIGPRTEPKMLTNSVMAEGLETNTQGHTMTEKPA